MKYIKTMVNEIILASKSEIRKKILENNKIICRIEPSNVDEGSVKESLLKEKATPTIISKNLAELKANKISQKFINHLVVGADSVIDLEGEIISKPKNRIQALKILQKLNGKTHQLVSSVCISRGGLMIWNYTDKASLTMKNMSLLELEEYLKKISDEALYAYNVYQIEGEGRTLFSKIEGDKETIMGLPVKQIKEYLNRLE
jgi:septum formation protein